MNQVVVPLKGTWRVNLAYWSWDSSCCWSSCRYNCCKEHKELILNKCNFQLSYKHVKTMTFKGLTFFNEVCLEKHTSGVLIFTFTLFLVTYSDLAVWLTLFLSFIFSLVISYFWCRGEQWILFPENLNVSPDEAEGNIEIRGKQNSLFPKRPVIKWFVI